MIMISEGEYPDLSLRSRSGFVKISPRTAIHRRAAQQKPEDERSESSGISQKKKNPPPQDFFADSLSSLLMRIAHHSRPHMEQ
jgi:hypothetical protein